MQSMQHRWLAVIAMGLMVSIAATAQDAARPKGEQPAKPSQEQQPANPTPPKIGAAAPDIELKGIDGKTYRLADYKDKTVVLEWLNQGCPYSKGAVPKIKALSESFKGKGVVWLAIDSTHGQTAEKDAKYAEDQKITHPILMDADGKVGHAYGAKTTPHVFIIHKGKIVYNGAFDNDAQKDKPKDEYRGYVEEALTAVLAGKDVPLATTDPWGCSVKYQK